MQGKNPTAFEERPRDITHNYVHFLYNLNMFIFCVQVFETVSAALTYIHEDIATGDKKCHVLITGSLHLVGNSLRFLDPELMEPVHHLPVDLKPLQNVYNGIQAIL